MTASSTEAGQFPQRLLTMINGATKYPEDQVVPLVIKSEKDFASARRLAAVKFAH